MKDEAKTGPLSTSEGGRSWARGLLPCLPTSGPGPHRSCAPNTLCLSKILFEGGGAGRCGTLPQPLGILKPPPFSTKGACKNLPWRLLAVHVCLPLGLFSRGSLCVLGAGLQAFPQRPLGFLRTGSLKAWPPLP